MNKKTIEVKLSDYELILNPLLNKGLSFTEDERRDFKLYGLLPPHIETLQEQTNRCYQAYSNKESDIEKYIYLRSLQDTCEVLFYNLLISHITEMLPIVYTPTVGVGCEQFSELYRHPRGLFISYVNKDNIDNILSHARFDSVEAIVVTDGERILGLGDQGAGGMGIPIGKLSLYTACAGIDPGATLPIVLDVGTNNQTLINDPMYVGWRHERIRGKDYDDFVDAFVTAIKKRFPHVLLQWEDFAQINANPILERYRDQLCTFNDDIQGTAAVATGTLLAALPLTGIDLREHKIAVLGAGSAGCGISSLLLQAMVDAGLDEEEALSRFYLVDRFGLLTEGTSSLLPFQEKFCQKKQRLQGWECTNANNITLSDVIHNAHPTVLIGVSGQSGVFHEALVKEMASHVARPVIFPLSNPTDHSEATPSDLLKWTNNQAIIGTGSPFPPALLNGVTKRIDQTNNSYIFPGMGLGIIASKASRVTDRMFMAAAKALAACSPAIKNPTDNLLPAMEDIRNVSFQIALAVAKEAQAAGLSNISKEHSLEELIQQKIWQPQFLHYIKSN